MKNWHYTIYNLQLQGVATQPKLFKENEGNGEHEWTTVLS